MVYRFETTEQNNQKANDYETKALLYLLSFRKDSKQIEVFAIDCFNDVTGCNKLYDKLWDVQSKNVKSLTPRTIGKALYTLFSNYEHDFPFEKFVLFIPKLQERYLVNENLETYDITNFKPEEQIKVIAGLEKEYNDRKNIKPSTKKIQDFFLHLKFVVGNKDKAEYIKKITNFKNNIAKEKFYEDIFNEIRDKQTAYKNIVIHNQEISTPSEVANTRKIFKRIDFDTLIINRFIGYDLFEDLNRIPNSFFDYLRDKNSEERKDIIQNANTEIARFLFDKNNKKIFWRFFEHIIITIQENTYLSNEGIYNVLKTSDIKIPKELSEETLLYLVSLVKDGWQGDAYDED